MPSFSIEAEGAATPLNSQGVLNALEAASGRQGTTHSVLSSGEQQLKNWEKTPGFYTQLQDIFLNASLPLEIRLLCLTQIKNGIDNHWRKTATYALSKDEKIHIRTRALEAGAHESNEVLIKFNGLILAKIARFEFPNEWPSLITDLINQLRKASHQQSANEKYLTSTLMTILPIVKELSTVRLSRMRSSLMRASPELVSVLGRIYLNLAEIWTNAIKDSSAQNGHSQDIIGVLTQSSIALKILRRLLVAGYEHANRANDVEGLWSIIQQQLDRFHPVVTTENSIADSTLGLITAHLRQFAKLHLEMARTQPAAFVLLPNFAPMLRNYLNLIAQLGHRFEMPSHGTDSPQAIGRDGDAADDRPDLERLGLKGLLIIRACVKMAFNPAQTFKYQHPEDKAERETSVNLIKTSVLTDEFVLQMMELLVAKFFIFREDELRNWEDEPEEWEKREEEIADAWEFSVRSCSEKLFLDLVINFKKLLVPRLLHVFRQHANVDDYNVRFKDSIYSAIGLAAPCLEDALDFNEVLKNLLIAEVQVVRPNYNLIRRRIAILLGQWVPIKPADLNRKTVYAIFQHLFDTSNSLNDQVVRVTAGRQFRKVLEPFEFQYEDFEPYATSLLAALMQLITEVELPETKMALLETVRVAITKMQGKLSPYADTLISMLPPLWDQSHDENLMKQAILTLITAIIHSLGAQSIKYHGLVLPLIQNSLEPGSESLLYLLEEALDLLSAITSQTPAESVSSELLSLSASLLPILEMGSDSLRQALEISESFIMLSPTTMLSPDMLPNFLTILCNLLPSSSTSTQSRNQVTLISTVLESLIRSITALDQDTAQQAITLLAQSLVSSGLLSKILSILQESYIYTLDPRPTRKAPSSTDITVTDLLTLLSRLAWLNPPIFIEAINAASPPPPPNESTITLPQPAFSWLVPAWLSYWDAIGDVNRKKLTALALTSLLCSLDGETPSRTMLESLQSMMSMWTDIVTELGEEAADKGGDYLVIWEEGQEQAHDSGAEEGWAQSAEEGRRRARSRLDPVYRVNIRGFLAERLQRLVVDVGGEEVFRNEWLGRVDEAVVRGFAELGVL
ncbi:MAG: hypothetical protein Q9227_000102 [Pyrenula ochraceoflavens]